MTLSPEFVLRIALSGVLGAIVGLERSRSGQSAGIRTNVMIAVASCLFTWLGVDIFSKFGTAPQDSARIAAQVVSGVGFLGAGTMLQTKNKIRGLTTAATIWLVAAVGMTVGVGEYWSAVFVTFIAVVALILLAPVSTRIKETATERYKERKEYEKHIHETEEERKKRMEALMLWLERRGHSEDNDDDEDDDVTIDD
jgi:putative Mg2+ transporter-C (MgtC) family protein